MIFAKERVEVIAAQLKKFSVAQSVPLCTWQVKEGFWLTPAEADADALAWSTFDSATMHWYGPDRHYWFRTNFTVPKTFEAKPLWLLLRTQIEEWDDAKNPQFLVFVNNVLIQGADMNHREIRLAEQAKAGDVYTIDLQAYSGILHPEFRLMGDMVEIVPSVEGLYYDILVPLEALPRMKADDKPAIDILKVLNDAINLLDLRDVPSTDFYSSVDAARAYLQKALYEDLAGYGDVIATCIGHTHIDVAWWWTVAQTREKVVRSFATVLELMRQYPDYKFMSSQPVLYTFLKERYPDLYAQIKERIKEGRWEAEGGMWLEADCNLTSGESLVRQFLYGKRFFKEEFGVDNRVLWLPDVFGYSGALPQIMKQCGIDYFMTTKLSWNQFNKVPNDTMMWEGIDGSRVLTHFISTLGVGQSVERFFTTYNGLLHPDAIMGGWERYQNKELNNDILISYGYGDGGGGPTREMLETGMRMEKGIKGVPKVRQAGSLQYFTELEARVKDDRRLPLWTGEFYFEYHRGTYTSMARNKRGNRKSELALMDVELLSVLASEKGVAYPAEALEKLWKMVLLNQFHDILPGSSIHEVYDVTKVEYEQIANECAILRKKCTDALISGAGVTVLNTLGFAHGGVAVLPPDVLALSTADGTVLPAQKVNGENWALLPNIPSKGFASFAAAQPQAQPSVFQIDPKDGGYAVETPYCSVIIDANGLFTSLFDKQNHREVLQKGKCGNQLRVYEDKPIYYDNWDIDVFYTEKFWDVNEVDTMEWTANGPILAELTIKRSFAHSKICQKIRFYSNTQRIDFDTWVDWHEHQHLLKVLFPVDIHTDEATFDVQFGNVTRKTHRNTSWDQARFESCAHKWVDVSEGGYGVSLLNDCKYGHSVHENEIGLTLIKSGIEPNATTDEEEHVFTYALLPHAGTWKEATTQWEAAQLNTPLCAVMGGTAGETFSFASVNADNLVLDTVKRAEDGSGVVLRIHESRNMRTAGVLTLHQTPVHATACNLLEQPQEALHIEKNSVHFTIKPYEIKTILVRF
ncbi:MAG: alpha-mannosidase [Ruthenibacterium sp.]